MSLSDFSPCRSDVVESRTRVVRLTGAGSSAPVVTEGHGVVATHAGTGDYKLTYSEGQGKYVGVKGYTFQSATMTDLAGYTIVVKDYDTTNFVVEFTVYNSTFAAADLTSAQSITLEIEFKETSPDSAL